MRALWLIVLTALLYSQSARAQFSAGLGLYTEMVFHLQSSEEATNGLFDPNLSFIFAYERGRSDWTVSPELIFSRLSSGDKFAAYLLQLNAVFRYSLWGPFDLRFGPGLYLRRVSGDGGTVSLRNGASGTTTGFAPSETNNALLVAWNVGVESPILSNLLFRLEFTILRLLGGTARKFNSHIALTYLF